MHAVSYLLKLQTDHVILDGHFQEVFSCTKRFLKLMYLKTWWSSKVDFKVDSKVDSCLKVLEEVDVTTTIENLTLVLDIKREHTLLILLYLPSGTIHGFITDLIQLIENVMSTVNVTRILLLGDFNLDQML